MRHGWFFREPEPIRGRVSLSRVSMRWDIRVGCITAITVIAIIVIGGLISRNALSLRHDAAWDFSHGRTSSVIGWPTDNTWSGRNWWAPNARNNLRGHDPLRDI